MRLLKRIIMLSCLVHASVSWSFSLREGNVAAHLGAFRTTQGKSQSIGIDQAIGNTYTLSQNHGNNVLLGLGYYLPEFHYSSAGFTFGLDVFYFPKTAVKGEVIQEELFNNLSYKYTITYLPAFISVKAILNNDSNNFAPTFSLGLGPDIIRTNNYREQSLDDDITQPDDAFTGHTQVTLSGMAGVGLKMNKLFKNNPVECGYRFFYLGHGQLYTKTNQLLSNMKTGSTYANAIFCSVYV